MEGPGHIRLQLDLAEEGHETMMAVLSTVGYYAFEEHPHRLDAYIAEADYSADALTETVNRFFPGLDLPREIEVLPPRDYNAEWEKNFQPVRVRDLCLVRPPFAPSEPGFHYEVIVAPKMAFGTGHHATTWLMIEQLGELEVAGKRVLDMGTGTGVLGILARKMGAAEVTAIDIDEWSYANARENAVLNGIADFRVIQGDVRAIPPDCYEIILANINRNVLLTDRDQYLAHLAPGGTLVLSGIYDFDEDILTEHYLEADLTLEARKARNEWVRLTFRKNDLTA
ncbi:MAG: 50S ribosomal protein L11 methyltransferase [Bacteroidota bacterium]